MISSTTINIPDKSIAEFCQINKIRRLALFGSVLREDFKPDSDVDMLVEFEPGVTLGLSFFRLQRELTDLIGHKVDLNTPADLSPYFRNKVLTDTQEIYDSAQPVHTRTTYA